MSHLSSVKRGISDLQGNDRGKVLAAVSAGWFVSIGARATFPVVLPYLRADYGLGYDTSGLLLTAMFLAYGIGALPGGIISDRMGEGRTLTMSMAAGAVTVGVVVASNSTILLFVGTLLFGFGAGVYGVARYTSLTNLYPDRVGSAIGIVNASSDAGQSILPPLAGVIAGIISWQIGFGYLIPLFVLVTVGLWVIVPARTSNPNSAVDTLSVKSLRSVFARLWRPRLVRATALLTLAMSVWQAFTGFYPTYLIEIKGISSTAAGILFGLFFVLGIGIKPIAGGSFDRYGVRRSLLVLTIISLLALVSLPRAGELWQLVGVTILVSPLLGYSTILISYMTVDLAEDMQGTGLGALRTVYWSLSSASPVLFGLVADRGFFNEAFYGLAALVGVMALLTFTLPE